MSIINNSKTDPNKILPIRYPWAREYYKTGVANNWTPEEVPMQRDVEQYKSADALTPTEHKLIIWNLGFFSTAESLTANNIVLAVYKHITSPEARQYLLRQAYEEAIHTDTMIYCCDTLGLDPDYVYNMYKEIPSIREKDDFVVGLTKSIFRDDFTTKGKENIRSFIRDLIGYYIIMEGLFFYAGFAMMLSLKRNNKMVGIGEQFEYIMRDESIHLAFGCQLIKTISEENPGIWNESLQKEARDLIKRAVELETQYVYDACPNGLLGMQPDEFCNYVKYIADRRLEQIALDKEYNIDNPFPWMSQTIDLRKEKNFFETRVTEYRVGSLEW